MSDILTRVEARLGEVGSRLNETTGGQALCRLDHHLASAKELEGRMAILMEVRRALRADGQADLSGITERWEADLATRVARGDSEAWLSYLRGGLAEVELLGEGPPEGYPSTQRDH